MKVVLLICILIDIILFNFIMYLYFIFFLTIMPSCIIIYCYFIFYVHSQYFFIIILDYTLRSALSRHCLLISD